MIGHTPEVRSYPHEGYWRCEVTVAPGRILMAEAQTLATAHQQVLDLWATVEAGLEGAAAQDLDRMADAARTPQVSLLDGPSRVLADFYDHLQELRGSPRRAVRRAPDERRSTR